MTSFYLKYRPQKVSDLDLVVVRQFLERLIKSGQPHHAYLLAGPKGTGKTSAARILAKILNCERGFGEPCNKCSHCVAIMRGIFLDLIEIDAASNRGIDDIRNLKETVGLMPLRGKKKVYLIDEVHMLTLEAFNALLKTLEEPPEHVVFVLATTAPERLPETVASRCVRVDFGKADIDEIVASLKKIIEAEKIKVFDGVVVALAEAADGSFRDAVKLLEQLVMGRRGQEITMAQVRRELGRSWEGGVKKLIAALGARQGKAAWQELEVLAGGGANWKVVIAESLELVRRELRKRFGVVIKGTPGLGSLTVEELKQLAAKLDLAGGELKDAVMPQLPLELVVAEWCPPQAAHAGGQAKEEELRKTPQTAKSRGKIKFEEVEDKWEEVLRAVRPKNHSLEGLLRSARPAKLLGDTLMVEVFYQFHLDRLKEDRFRQMVEQSVEEVFAFPLKLQYSLGSASARKIALPVMPAEVEDAELVRAAEEIFGG